MPFPHYKWLQVLRKEGRKVDLSQDDYMVGCAMLAGYLKWLDLSGLGLSCSSDQLAPLLTRMEKLTRISLDNNDLVVCFLLSRTALNVNVCQTCASIVPFDPDELCVPLHRTPMPFHRTARALPSLLRALASYGLNEESQLLTLPLRLRLGGRFSRCQHLILCLPRRSHLIGPWGWIDVIISSSSTKLATLYA